MKKRFSNYQEYLQSPEWEILRRLAHEQAGYCCRLCGSAEELHVHHRAYPKQYGTEQLSDLVVLCKKCHSNYHSINKNEDDLVVIIKETAKFMKTIAKGVRRIAEELDDMASMQQKILAEMAEPEKTPTATAYDEISAFKESVGRKSNVAQALLVGAKIKKNIELRVITIECNAKFAYTKLSTTPCLDIVSAAAHEVWPEFALETIPTEVESQEVYG